MSKDTSGPAFPRTVQAWNGHLTAHDGMTLRDYFAGQALIGLPGVCAHDTLLNGVTFEEHVARNAYKLADAMLEARK